jgi:hypothetical protein
MKNKRPKPLTTKAKKRLGLLGPRDKAALNQKAIHGKRLKPLTTKGRQRLGFAAKDAVVEIQFSKLTVKKLRAFLKEKGIKVPPKSKKAELVLLAEGVK